MPTVIRPDLAWCSPSQITEWLERQGLTVGNVELILGALHVEVTDAPDEAAINTALLGYVEEQPGRLPAAFRAHTSHLRDYFAADLVTITNADTVHVVKDLIRAVHHLNRRIASE